MGRPKGSKNKPKQVDLVAKAILNTTSSDVHLSSGTTTFLGVYDSFEAITVTPNEGDTAIVDYAEYIYSSSSWHKITYLGTYESDVFPSSSPNEYDLIGQVSSVIEYPFTVNYKIYINGDWADFSNFRLTLNVKEIDD